MLKQLTILILTSALIINISGQIQIGMIIIKQISNNRIDRFGSLRTQFNAYKSD